MRERDVTKSLSYVFDQSHHPHMGRCLKTDKECTHKKLEISQLKIILWPYLRQIRSAVGK